MIRQSMQGSEAARRTGPGLALAAGCAALVLGAAVACAAEPDRPSAGGAAAASAEAGPAAGRRTATARAPRGDALEARVRALTQALTLDAGQQAALRELLQRQRATVSGIWSDPKLLPAERGPAVHAATDRTAEEIRAILNDEQKLKYSPPKPAQSKALQEAGGSVEKWMDATREKNTGAAPPRN